MAVGGIIFNLGDVDGTKHILDKCGLELQEIFVDRLRDYEEKGEQNRALWMSKKGKIRRTRMKKLGKYQTASEGRKKYKESHEYVDSQQSADNMSWKVREEMAKDYRDKLENEEKERKRLEKEEAKAKKNEQKRKEREEKQKRKLEEKEQKKRERDEKRERKKRERNEEKELKKAAKKAKL